MKLALYLAAAPLALVAMPSVAAVIQTLPGGTAVAMPANSYQGVGPQTFGPIAWTSSSANSLFGYTGAYNFLNNGAWSGTPMTGLNAASGTMTYTFAQPVSAVLAEMNWSVAQNRPDVTASVFDVNGVLLETKTFVANGVALASPGYWGFQQNTPIGSLQLSNSFIGARNFSIETVTGVPEPATWAMMVAGFGAVGAGRRRRRAMRVRFA